MLLLWGELLPRASELGPRPSVTVGIAATRSAVSRLLPLQHGLACIRVTAIELVTAGGEQIRVDAENEPDLFWRCAAAAAASVSSRRSSSVLAAA
jgi:hypothetical protein